MAAKCHNCYVTGGEKPLHRCAGCQAAKYCSKECQRAKHKPACHNNATLVNALKQHESTPLGFLDRLALPDGISLYELDQRLEKWVRFHTMTLMEAHAHACRLPEDIGNIRTKVVYVKLAAREDHGGIPAKYFRVVDAYPISVVEAMWRPSPWPGSLLQLKSMQDESEQLGRGRMGAAMIECPPLAVQTVPFGSVTEQSLRGLTIASNWKEVLMHLVEGGTRFSGRKSGR